MKTLRIFLSVVALVLGFAGAVASKTMADITNRGVIYNTDNEHPTQQSGQCDRDLSAGIQCTLSVSGTPLAYQVGASTTPLFKPAR